MLKYFAAFALMIGSFLPGVTLAKKINIVVAAYLPNVDTSTRVDSHEGRVGAVIDFEEDLNLDDNESLPAISFEYHFTKKLGLELAYFDLSRSSERRIQETINFGDETFNVNELLKSKFSVDIYRLALNYDFWMSEKWQLGTGFGFHITRFDVGLSAPERDVETSIDKTAPLPYLSLDLGYALSSKWHLGSHVEIMSIDLGSIEGSMLNAYVGIEYAINPTFSTGFAYNTYNLSAESDSLGDDLEGEFEYQYSGPLLYAKFHL